MYALAHTTLGTPHLTSSAARQEEAEGYFLLADTSGDGLVDEEELVALCAQLLRVQAARATAVLAAYVQRFRDDPAVPLNLDFDAFVRVYNALLKAQMSGELHEALHAAS